MLVEVHMVTLLAWFWPLPPASMLLDSQMLWHLHCTFCFTLTFSHIAFSGDTCRDPNHSTYCPASPDFLWNIGRKLHAPIVLAYCMSANPASREWHRGLLPSWTTVGPTWVITAVTSVSLWQNVGKWILRKWFLRQPCVTLAPRCSFLKENS